MKIAWKDELLMILIVAAMFVIAAMMWSRVPDVMPVHYGWSGQVDRMGDRFEGLFGLPLVALGLYGLFLLLPYIDPRRAHYETFRGPYRMLRILILALLLAGQVLQLARLEGGVSLGGPRRIPLIIGLVLVILGNYLPKLQSNWFVGVRTPWTLSSEESWRQTHRLAGWLCVIGGLLLLAVATFWPSLGLQALMFTLVVIVVTSVVYSFIACRRDPARARPSEIE